MHAISFFPSPLSPLQVLLSYLSFSSPLSLPPCCFSSSPSSLFYRAFDDHQDKGELEAQHRRWAGWEIMGVSEPSFPLLPAAASSRAASFAGVTSRVRGALRLLWVSVESEGGGKKSSGERNSRIGRDHGKKAPLACMRVGIKPERE